MVLQSFISVGREHFEVSIQSKNHRVTPKRLPLWETAVKVAEKALPMNRQERQLCFTFKYNDSLKQKDHTVQKVKGINGISQAIEHTSPKKHVESTSTTLDTVNGTNSDELDQEKLDMEESNTLGKIPKVKIPKKRKRKIPDVDNSLPSSSIPSSNDGSIDSKPSGTRVTKRIRKPKIKDLPLTTVPSPKSPLQNGEIPESPVCGNVSPSSGLRLKIIKVKSPANNDKVKRKRGRPPKEKETFIVVNGLENPESEQPEASKSPLVSERVSPTVVNSNNKPDVSSTSSSGSEEKQKKRKRRKLEDSFVASEKTTVEEEKPKVKRKYVRKKKGEKSEEKGISKTVKEENKLNEVSSSVDIIEEKKPEKPQESLLNGVPEIEESIISSNDDDTGSSKGLTLTKKERAEKEKEAVCVVCEQVNDLIFCEGGCNNAYHTDCIGLSSVPKGKFICDECTSGIHSCFVCRQTGDVKQCNQPMCSKYYHLDCLKTYNCTKIDGERFYCPLHSCVTCVVNKMPQSRGRLIRCVRCPTAYHLSGCLVAGCMPITSHLMVCAKHFMPNKNKAHHSHVNVNWCFVCSIGGTLICCESCPAAFHPECISYEGIPEGHFFCKDCTDNKALLYGDIVWVKLGMYRSVFSFLI